METLKDFRTELEKEQQAAETAKAFYQWFLQHPEIRACEANKNVAVAYHNGDPITLESLTDSLNSAEFRKMLAWQDETDVRERLLKELKPLLRGSAEAVKMEFDKTKYQTNAEIQAKVEELTRRRELENKTPQQLRQVIKDNTPEDVETELPEKWTRKSLLALSGPEFKKICERYGLKATTRALNTRMD